MIEWHHHGICYAYMLDAYFFLRKWRKNLSTVWLLHGFKLRSGALQITKLDVRENKMLKRMSWKNVNAACESNSSKADELFKIIARKYTLMTLERLISIGRRNNQSLLINSITSWLSPRVLDCLLPIRDGFKCSVDRVTLPMLGQITFLIYQAIHEHMSLLACSSWHMRSKVLWSPFWSLFWHHLVSSAISSPPPPIHPPLFHCQCCP